MTHPENLLAEYVDGTLDAPERAEVEAHLARCETCRTDVDLAGAGRMALRSLGERDVPPDVVRPGLGRRVPRGPSGEGGRVLRRAAPLAIAAAVIGLLSFFVSTGAGRPSGASVPESRASGAAPSTPPAPSTAPILRRSGRDYTRVDVRSLASALATQFGPLQAAAGTGGASSAGATSAGKSASSTNAVRATASPATTSMAPNAGADSSVPLTGAPATVCLHTAGRRPGSLLELIEARYRGLPAFITAFLRDGGHRTIAVWVIDARDCSVLTTITHPLP